MVSFFVGDVVIVVVSLLAAMMMMMMMVPFDYGVAALTTTTTTLVVTRSSSTTSFMPKKSSHHNRQDRPLWATTTTKSDVDDDSKVLLPYQGQQPADALSEIFIPNIFSPTKPSSSTTSPTIDDDDELLWIPQSDTVSFRPLCFCVSSGYYVNLLRVRAIEKGKMGFLSRHRHPGPVHGYVIKGSWKYLEHDWIATPGSYVFEPPGEIHTLVTVPTTSSSEGGEDVDDNEEEEMITLFHVTGSLLYCDEHGNVVGAEDVFTKLQKAKEYYQSIGLDDDYIQQFVR